MGLKAQVFTIETRFRLFTVMLFGSDVVSRCYNIASTLNLMIGSNLFLDIYVKVIRGYP